MCAGFDLVPVSDDRFVSLPDRFPLLGSAIVGFRDRGEGLTRQNGMDYRRCQRAAISAC